MVEFELCFAKEDKKMLDEVYEFFGKDIPVYEIDGLDAIQIICVCISVASLTVQITDFIMSRFPNKSIPKTEQPYKERRFIRTRDGDIYTENYEAYEINEFIEASNK